MSTINLEYNLILIKTELNSLKYSPWLRFNNHVGSGADWSAVMRLIYTAICTVRAAV